MRKVRTVFCPDFLAQYKSIPLWRSTVFGWTALMMRSSRSVLLSPPVQWTTGHCWRGCGHTVSDPVLTQNRIGAGRTGRKQRKIRRANGGKKHKSEPKRLRFVRETTYGPEGRGFESLTACQKIPNPKGFGIFCFYQFTRFSLLHASGDAHIPRARHFSLTGGRGWLTIVALT